MLKELKLKNFVIKKPVFSAPLAGVSDFAFREIVRSFDKDILCFSEMISCHSLINHYKHKKLTPQEKIEEGIVAQIFGNDIEKMAESAKILESMGAVMIDINMGCPVKKVLKAGGGCAMLEDLPLAGRVIEAVSKAVKIPVSVKTRIGLNNEKITIFDFLNIAQESGACMITVHGRTKAQLYSGSADWDIIKQVKDKATIPVIGNGDIVSLESFNEKIKYGVDGVMIGRGLLGKPWLLKECLENKKIELTVPQIKEVCLKHLYKTCELYGEKPAVKIFRKHASWYSIGMSNAAGFRFKVNNTESLNDMQNLINEFFI